jgi:hypothetical protein
MSDLVCPVVDLNMGVPISVKLTFVAASICSLKLLLFPALLQEIKLSTQFVITTSVIFSVWSFWKVFIYPSWIDPLRHLPKAKVCKIIPRYLIVLS